MKWIALAPMFILLAACGCCSNTDVLEFRSVSYTPTVVANPDIIVSGGAVPTPKTVVVRPIHYDPATLVQEDPIDVTTTTIDYY